MEGLNYFCNCLTQVEVLGKTWSPKIAGTYETELFTDSGWKAAKNLEITPQVLSSKDISYKEHLVSETFRKLQTPIVLTLAQSLSLKLWRTIVTNKFHLDRK